jgi:hypothetical protein
LGTLFSGCIFLHVLAKIVFNIAAKIKLVLDPWTVIDFISAAFNLFCFNYIGNVKSEQIMDPA